MRQAESGNKAPYCPPLLALKDGINWPDKRYQRKVLLRVLEFNRPLHGSRAENRKVPSVIKAGLHPPTAANDLVLITRKVYSSPRNLLKISPNFALFPLLHFFGFGLSTVDPSQHTHCRPVFLSPTLHFQCLDDLKATLLLYPSRLLEVTKHHFWRQKNENEGLKMIFDLNLSG